jgi:predicted metalloprotease with PDZ domain
MISAVVAALNQVAPFDWKTFLLARVNATRSGAPLDGIDRAGWRLAYTDVRNDYLKALEQGEEHTTDLAYSLGVRLGVGGTIVDAVVGSPAFVAGLGPGMRILTVGGRAYSPDGLRAALSLAARPGPPIFMQIDNEGMVTTMPVDYRGGLREPHLQQVPGRPDVLASILATHVRR